MNDNEQQDIQRFIADAQHLAHIYKYVYTDIEYLIHILLPH
jgi:hypothetical protein